ncbi:SMG7 [Fusarium albosuccineum]|uniref:Nonsense-mediated mRNA decay factor n=1 Tax=Fusarium albosuccineum TaxID=1237068 RepID=A0A8H4LDZ1_9HYPO|nr:SMG7 [Fusarium albosuccineum]
METTAAQAATPEHADLSAKAKHTWRTALKLRKLLTKHLEKLPKDNNSGVDITQFEAIDSVLDKFRLACVQTIYLDFEYAITERTDQAMWTVHTSINNEYRRTLGRLRHLAQNSDKQKADKAASEKRNGDKPKGDKQNAPKQKNDRRNVEKRKFGEKYLGFLHVAQEFYKGYVQRLSARYDIPELKRIAQGIEVDGSSSSDIISPVPGQIYPLVLNSCHFTLICLGDLARYQVQTGLKKSSYRIALAYYSLAYDLKPDSGFPFHQMGIISLEEGKDLDVVYYFYRSIATADPHPNARQNLESKFKTILQPDKNPSKKQTRGMSDPFVTWFTKLHASYYRDEVMSYSSELEREVLHRLDRAAKGTDHVEVLFKMTLINISSYYVASQKFTESQSPAASRFCQHTLRLNSQFILAFCSSLESELVDIVSRESHESEDPATAKSSRIIEYLLPLLRIYGMWLAARRHEIFAAGDALGVVLLDMVKALSKVFSLLCNDTYTQEKLASCPYLLTEDVETQGLLPLSKEQVPLACRSSFDENGILKPRLSSPENRLEPFQELLARILDILRCAYFLAEDNSCPLAYHVSDRGLAFEYQEIPVVNKVAPQPMEIVNSPVQEITTKNKNPSRYRTASDNRQPEIRPVVKETTGKAPVVSPRAQVHQRLPSPDHAENTVINMLAPFLKPPTPEPAQLYHRSPDETSYGMHSTTANEVFGMLQSEPSPTGSIPSAKFEPLPWNWVYTPTPQKGNDDSASACKNAFDGPVSPNFSSRELPQAVSTLEDPFTNSTPQLLTGQTPRVASGSMGSPPGVPGADEAHRNNLLQSFVSTSAPRTSMFSQWGQNSTRLPKETVASSYGHQAFTGYPISSAASAFSHPSSLYQGTPANGAAFGMPGASYLDMHRYDRGQSQSQDPGPVSSNRRFQMDETTSSYDAAILQAAFYGNK